VIKRSHLIRLRDILENIDAVAEMMTGVDLAAYRQDLKLRRAVERCVEIVSEASRRIPDELKVEFSEQPWPEIAAIGNLLRHSYERIDDLIMWKIATRSLPELRRVIVAMIERST
jgi:uncharacterized protein with HEPN domain